MATFRKVIASRNTFLRRFSVLDGFGRFSIVFGPFRTVSDGFGLFRMVADRFRTVLDAFGSFSDPIVFGLVLAVLDDSNHNLKNFKLGSESSKTIRNGPKTIQNRPKRSENHPKPSETVRKRSEKDLKPSETLRKRSENDLNRVFEGTTSKKHG